MRKPDKIGYKDTDFIRLEVSSQERGYQPIINYY